MRRSEYFSNKNEALHATMVSDVPFLLITTQWSSYKVNFTRIGIQLLGSISSAKVSMIFSTTDVLILSTDRKKGNKPKP